MSYWIQEEVTVKKILGTALTALLTLSTALPAQAAGTEPMLIPVQEDEALFILAEDDDRNLWGSTLKLQPDGPDENLERQEWIDCPTIDDPICDLNKPGYSGLAGVVFPVCEDDKAEDCVARFGFELDGQYYPGVFVSSVNSGGTFPAKPSLNLYRGGQSALFRVAEVPHDKGDLYLVSPIASMNHERNRNGKFVTNDFYLNVIPVSIQPRSAESSYPNANPCVWRNETECAIRGSFNINSKVSVELRLTNEVGGWFLGRMKDPTISVVPFSARNNTITLSAYPVKVARFAYKKNKKDVTFEDRKATGNSGSMGTLDGDGAVRFLNGGYDTSNFGMLNYFRSKVNDTAIGTSTIFQMRTTSRDEGNACLRDRSRVLGIVTTNAMVYDGFTPRFSRGFLDYRVAGLHYEADGVTEVIGSYDLVMRSDVARCLYRFSKAPVGATITITGEGDKNIATTVVGERNGWLKLGAYGFTFSNKTIKVKLTQKKTTITCVTTKKPINTRKVTGLAPKCPAGFKKR